MGVWVSLLFLRLCSFRRSQMLYLESACTTLTLVIHTFCSFSPWCFPVFSISFFWCECHLGLLHLSAFFCCLSFNMMSSWLTISRLPIWISKPCRKLARSFLTTLEGIFHSDGGNIPSADVIVCNANHLVMASQVKHCLHCTPCYYVLIGLRSIYHSLHLRFSLVRS